MEELNDDQRMEIVTLMDSTLREARPDELDADTVFCEEADFSNPSAALGKACTDDRPVVSFTFREVDKRDTIEGFLRAGTGKKSTKSHRKKPVSGRNRTDGCLPHLVEGMQKEEP